MSLSSPEQVLAGWEALGLPGARPPRLLGELPGGRTNRNYLLAADDERWVLRLDAPHGRALGIDRARELRILRAASAAGLAPDIIAADNARGFLVTRHLAGQHPQPAALTDGALVAVLTLLARVHALVVADVDIDYRQHLAHYLAPDETFPADTAARLARLETGSPRGLSHHDAVPANIILAGGRVWLIDWEYAAAGWPVLDLATLVVDWGVRAPRIAELSGCEPALLTEACGLYRDLCALWARHGGSAARPGTLSADGAAVRPSRGD